jgi:hypothetical protein
MSYATTFGATPSVDTQLSAAVGDAIQASMEIAPSLSPPAQLALYGIGAGVNAAGSSISALQSGGVGAVTFATVMDVVDVALDAVIGDIPIVGTFFGFVADVIEGIVGSGPTLAQQLKLQESCKKRLQENAPRPSGGALDSCSICPPDYFGKSVHHTKGCAEVYVPGKVPANGLCDIPLLGTAMMLLFEDPDFPVGSSLKPLFKELQLQRPPSAATLADTTRVGSHGICLIKGDKTDIYKKRPSAATKHRFHVIRRALEAMHEQGVRAKADASIQKPSLVVALSLWSVLMELLVREIDAKNITKCFAEHLLDSAMPGLAHCQIGKVLQHQIWDMAAQWRRTINPTYAESAAKLAEMRAQADVALKRVLGKSDIKNLTNVLGVVAASANKKKAIYAFVAKSRLLMKAEREKAQRLAAAKHNAALLQASGGSGGGGMWVGLAAVVVAGGGWWLWKHRRAR